MYIYFTCICAIWKLLNSFGVSSNFRGMRECLSSKLSLELSKGLMAANDVVPKTF